MGRELKGVATIGAIIGAIAVLMTGSIFDVVVILGTLAIIARAVACK